jgi:signal transduction histidine kinase
MRGPPGTILRSLRARATLAFALGAVVVVAASSALLYRLLVGQLSDALDADLAARGDDVAVTVRAGGAQALRTDPLAQLYDSEGRVRASSLSLSGRNLRLLSAQQVRAVTAPVTTTVQLPLGRDDRPVPVRLLSQRVEPAGAVVTVGVSTGPLRQARQRLLAVLLGFAPVLVGLLALAAWLLVSAALRPVDALTRRAMEISRLDGDGGLPVVPGDDEIARLARTLDGMLARLREVFERERAFVEDASHELRTPIAVLRGELELALSVAGDEEEVRRSLRNALGEAERLTRLAEDLLVLARAQAGVLATRREMVDLLDLARAEGRRLAPVLGLRVEVSGDPVVVRADPVLLRQALANLAVNSATAGATVLAVMLSHREGWVVVEVADDGPGFPVGLLPRLFERFVRGAPRAPGTTGAGLGLAIVKAVVAAHGGTVHAANGGPRGGAVVTLRLPTG